MATAPTRAEREIPYDYRDRAQQRRMIHDHFDGFGWKVPVLLGQVDADDDFYFDKVNQVRMPVWSKGRIALVGNAGYCVSPLAGRGGSMAIIGAARLADALQRHGIDHDAAFREYHDQLHGFVEEVQERAITFGMAMMFPSDKSEIAASRWPPCNLSKRRKGRPAALCPAASGARSPACNLPRRCRLSLANGPAR